ncbi:hypothetical protein MMC10_009082 [Thelotrema lepadinum]|nr:hypothetical protein [Thelotrema lepadinum]
MAPKNAPLTYEQREPPFLARLKAGISGQVPSPTSRATDPRQARPGRSRINFADDDGPDGDGPVIVDERGVEVDAPSDIEGELEEEKVGGEREGGEAKAEVNGGSGEGNGEGGEGKEGRRKAKEAMGSIGGGGRKRVIKAVGGDEEAVEKGGKGGDELGGEEDGLKGSRRTEGFGEEREDVGKRKLGRDERQDGEKEKLVKKKRKKVKLSFDDE